MAKELKGKALLKPSPPAGEDAGSYSLTQTVPWSSSSCLLRTWFSGGFGSVRFMVGLDDLKGLFRPKWFCGSMIFP